MANHFAKSKYDEIWVHSLGALREVEEEVLRRIHQLPNGGLLFMTHPFLLLEDLNVYMDPEVVTLLCELEPRLGQLDSSRYHELRKGPVPEEVSIRVRRLFSRAIGSLVPV